MEWTKPANVAKTTARLIDSGIAQLFPHPDAGSDLNFPQTYLFWVEVHTDLDNDGGPDWVYDAVICEDPSGQLRAEAVPMFSLTNNVTLSDEQRALARELAAEWQASMSG